VREIRFTQPVCRGLTHSDDVGESLRAYSQLQVVEGSEGIMKTALVVSLHEGQGFLQDQGWDQTARLMTLAATEIERLSERVRELEDKALRPPSPRRGQASHRRYDVT